MTKGNLVVTVVVIVITMIVYHIYTFVMFNSLHLILKYIYH
jgi:hypothetical protein